jgi:hypothetical protein
MQKHRRKYSRFEKIIDSIVLLGLITFWCIIWKVNQNPDQILPTHFNIQGTADSFGNATNLYILGFINTFLILGLYILKARNIPLNFGQEITANNKEAIMQVMRKTVSIFALSILIIFGIILYETITYNSSQTPYLFILILFCIKIPIIFYFIKTQNIKQ